MSVELSAPASDLVLAVGPLHASEFHRLGCRSLLLLILEHIYTPLCTRTQSDSHSPTVKIRTTSDLTRNQRKALGNSAMENLCI